MKGTLQAAIATCLLAIATAQQGCDYRQTLVAGRSYDVFSPGYPQRYRGEQNCRWTAVAPAGMIIHIDCRVMELPTSTNCRNDRVLVSREGLASLSGALSFCGTTRIIEQSVGNTLVVGFRSPRTSLGGRFLCSLTARPCECGRRRTSRIVGGTEAGVNEFPMMAGLVDSRIRSVICGAVIISNSHALTAAHCTRSVAVTRAGLLVGEHDLSTGLDTPFTQLLTVSRYIVHPGYLANPSRNDIALVQPRTLIFFNAGVAPVCLPFLHSANTFQGTRVEAAGWGTLEYGGPRSNRLQRVTLDVVANSVCTSRLNNPNILTSHLCTFTPGRDTCQYDSGGPLMWTNPRNGLLYLTSLASFGSQCATTPSVNTRVTSFLTWIRQNTPGVQYCTL
ncbi:venom serine protease 34-like [Phlebotomus argentipes]|uniref:venom serine protease 34-like n=1 Tax=Phlebotomus argentipes TaxID=94469 RepID=UPI0028932872|nr:venom serine protease 34-like [Phlebotomus argentipes]